MSNLNTELKALVSGFGCPLPLLEDARKIAKEHQVGHSQMMIEAVALWLFNHHGGDTWHIDGISEHLSRAFERSRKVLPATKQKGDVV